MELPPQPTLPQIQSYVREVLHERGFDHETVAEKFMLLMEECGELAKATRKSQGIKTDASSEQFQLGHEAADVLMYLLDICNRYDIDLESAFRQKEEINKTRSWS